MFKHHQLQHQPRKLQPLSSDLKQAHELQLIRTIKHLKNTSFKIDNMETRKLERNKKAVTFRERLPSLKRIFPTEDYNLIMRDPCETDRLPSKQDFIIRRTRNVSVNYKVKDKSVGSCDNSMNGTKQPNKIVKDTTKIVKAKTLENNCKFQGKSSIPQCKIAQSKKMPFDLHLKRYQIQSKKKQFLEENDFNISEINQKQRQTQFLSENSFKNLFGQF